MQAQKTIKNFYLNKKQEQKLINNKLKIMKKKAFDRGLEYGVTMIVILTNKNQILIT